jgi:hypothetical protein
MWKRTSMVAWKDMLEKDWTEVFKLNKDWKSRVFAESMAEQIVFFW